jgi:integration host factor subunit alpha
MARERSSKFEAKDTMTKADIAEKIQTTTGLSKKDSLKMLEAVFLIMKSTLEAGEKIKIAGFGNFEVKQKESRIARNPQTGETITIEARKILSYKPSMMLRQAVNK